NLARNLSHHLHQAPGKAAGVSFRCGDLVIGVERRDVLAEEERLVAHGPGVPTGFLFDNGADQCWIQRLRAGGFARESEELRRSAGEHGFLPCSKPPLRFESRDKSQTIEEGFLGSAARRVCWERTRKKVGLLRSE